MVRLLPVIHTAIVVAVISILQFNTMHAGEIDIQSTITSYLPACDVVQLD